MERCGSPSCVERTRRTRTDSSPRVEEKAAVWAEEFAKVHPEIDQGLMIGWFANAIETARGFQPLATEGVK